jgi:hypothetical protein
VRGVAEDVLSDFTFLENEEVPMLFLAGEEVSEEKQLRCQKCAHEVRVPKGSSVPKCSKCGHDIFESSEPDGNGEG